MDKFERSIIKSKLVPYPDKIIFTGGYLQLEKDTNIAIHFLSGKDINKKDIINLIKSYWNIKANIVLKKVNNIDMQSNDGYEIEINNKQIIITSKDLKGVLNSFRTLRQLGEVERGVRKYAYTFFPKCKIKDSPFFSFRGVHLCWFPETNIVLLEKAIRMAAYYKFNYIILEFWGIFPFIPHPEVSYKGIISREKIRKIFNIGKKLGLKFIPCFNFLGHASGARSVYGKHSTLDIHPELQSLFEPNGWSWCLTNPETKKLQIDIIEELIGLFDNPDFFHIGFDEAYDIGTCETCRKSNVKDLVLDRILCFYNFLKKRNIKTMIWHDMLLNFEDKRWKGFVACGRKEHKIWEVLDHLPKDIIIVDWEYSYKNRDKDEGKEVWPTLKFFNQKDFDVIAASWRNARDIISYGKAAKQEKVFGILATTWHRLSESMFGIFYFTSQTAWGTKGIYDDNVYKKYYTLANTVFNYHLRQITRDMGIKEYKNTGTVPINDLA